MQSLLHVVSLLASVAVAVKTGYEDLPLNCAYDRNNATCNEPIDSVTILRPNSLYFAKLPCPDCPTIGFTGERAGRKHIITHEENDLIFNIKVSSDRRVVYLNRVPIFPSLISSSTSEPPRIVAEQLRTNFSREDFDTALSSCDSRFASDLWCSPDVISTTYLDYDYSAVQIKERDGIHLWNITFDAIGGTSAFQGDPTWSYNDTKQLMLHITVMGTEIKDEDGSDSQGRPAGSGSLFGSIGNEKEIKYELDIVDVQLTDRTYTFPAPPPSTTWSKLKHFFGFDPPYPENHVIRLQNDWDWYARKGSLKQLWGGFIYWDFWYLFWIIFGSTIAGLVVLYGIYRLFFWVLEQRSLAQWGGMDEVWSRMRREDSEDQRLLDGGYRDDPDDPLPPRYTDELPVNKPLPDKPLPDKPLPAVPLIDDL